MSGPWEITPQDDYDMDREDETAPRVMNIYEDVLDGKTQFWANFKFGNSWSGIMRLCPSGALPGEEFTLKEFEEACVLKDGTQAGPPPQGTNQWLIKGRGTLVEKYSTPENALKHRDRITTSFTVRGSNKDGKLTLRGVLLKGCKVCSWTGVRTGNAPPRGVDDPTFKTLWENLAYKEPPPPKLYQWKTPLPAEPVQTPP